MRNASEHLTAISIFSGGGGLDLGAARAGVRTRVAVEYEKYACETLRHNQALRKAVGSHQYLAGCAVVEADIRSLSVESILASAGLAVGEADFLIGGPPCVSYSVAGRREGLGSATGQLVDDYVRILEGAQPRAFLFENVRGMTSAPGRDGERGGALAAVLTALAGTGYALSWRVVDAADYGVPQHRHRLLVIGVRGENPLEFPSPTHDNPTRLSLPGQHGLRPEWRNVRDAIGDLPPATPYGSEAEVPNHVARRHLPETVESLRSTPPGKRNARLKRDRLLWTEPAKTIRAQGKPKANGSGQKNSSHQSIHPDEHRQLTVRESARIQTFPDWYWFHPTFVNGYRVVGDAVPPLLAERLVAAVVEQLEARTENDSEGRIATAA